MKEKQQVKIVYYASMITFVFFTLVIISFTSYSGFPQWLSVTSGVLGNLMMIPAVLAVVVLLGISLFQIFIRRSYHCRWIMSGLFNLMSVGIMISGDYLIIL